VQVVSGQDVAVLLLQHLYFINKKPFFFPHFQKGKKRIIYDFSEVVPFHESGLPAVHYLIRES